MQYNIALLKYMHQKNKTLIKMPVNLNYISIYNMDKIIVPSSIYMVTSYCFRFETVAFIRKYGTFRKVHYTV